MEKLKRELYVENPYPQWVKDDLAKFIVENFDEEERKAFCEKILKSEDVQKKGDS